VPGRRSFNYVWQGTIDLFAALNTATGKVIGQLSAQYRPSASGTSWMRSLLHTSQDPGY
jgi:hypothetical protein